MQQKGGSVRVSPNEMADRVSAGGGGDVAEAAEIGLELVIYSPATPSMK